MVDHHYLPSCRSPFSGSSAEVGFPVGGGGGGGGLPGGGGRGGGGDGGGRIGRDRWRLQGVGRRLQGDEREKKIAGRGATADGEADP
jgi:hypothetical protein